MAADSVGFTLLDAHADIPPHTLSPVLLNGTDEITLLTTGSTNCYWQPVAVTVRQHELFVDLDDPAAQGPCLANLMTHAFQLKLHSPLPSTGSITATLNYRSIGAVPARHQRVSVERR